MQDFGSCLINHKENRGTKRFGLESFSTGCVWFIINLSLKMTIIAYYLKYGICHLETKIYRDRRSIAIIIDVVMLTIVAEIEMSSPDVILSRSTFAGIMMCEPGSIGGEFLINPKI